MDVYFDKNINYICIIVIKIINQFVIKNILYFINNNRLLLYKYNDINKNFKIILRITYIKKYRCKKIYNFDHRFIQYSNKFDFTNKCVNYFRFV